MATRATIYLLLLVAGIAFLVGGLFLTRLQWRADIEPFGPRSRLFQIALHPGNFARTDRLALIRLLNGIGGLLLLGALGVVAFDLLSGLGAAHAAPGA